MLPRRTLVRFGGLVLAAALLAVACATQSDSPVILGSDTDAAPTPTFAQDAGTDADADASPLLCPATGESACPAPYGTCAGGSQCAIDLSQDPKNCGSCGNDCNEGLAEIGWAYLLGMNVECVKGHCDPTCDLATYPFHRDCNGYPDDGCEMDVQFDVNNCGACGNECPAGTRCYVGQCGCPAGETMCEATTPSPGVGVDLSTTPPTYFACRDLRTDDNNCAVCGTACADAPDACAPPAHSGYGCAGASCGKLKCANGFGDCNSDFAKGCASDGCEANLRTDHDNCGACGVVCGADQICGDANDDKGTRCLCAPGETRCGGAASPTCADLLGDPQNCGACGNVCPRPNLAGTIDNGFPVCRRGVCDYECKPGKGDCDGDTTNGCETDLRVDPLHCGGCGVRCDTAAGQPCLNGACLMVACDAGTVTK